MFVQKPCMILFFIWFTAARVRLADCIIKCAKVYRSRVCMGEISRRFPCRTCVDASPILHTRIMWYDSPMSRRISVWCHLNPFPPPLRGKHIILCIGCSNKSPRKLSFPAAIRTTSDTYIALRRSYCALQLIGVKWANANASCNFIGRWLCTWRQRVTSPTDSTAVIADKVLVCTCSAWRTSQAAANVRGPDF